MTEHYFSEKPQSIFRKEYFEAEILGQKIHIHSGSGIFSINELDFGTKLLIENAKLPSKLSPQNAEILDLGCGYGIIGIALKKKHPELNMTLVDINERAVKLSKQNCKENKVDCTVLQSDVLSNPELKDKKYEVILTNPPFSAGKKTCIEFIKQSYSHLNKNGLLELVAPHNKGGESLKKIMLETFGNADELAKKSGFRIYVSEKR